MAQLTMLPAESPGAQWITDAIEELEHIDGEVAEDALPEIHADTRKHARRMILVPLPKTSLSPRPSTPRRTVRSLCILSHRARRLPF